MKNRNIAFLIHISLSVVVAVIALFIVLLLWYPAPLHLAMGVTELFFLLLAVDVILGPVITFIIYKPKKKYLLFDLSIIALFQVVALSYGLHTIFQGRPAFMVFSTDRFETVRIIDIEATSAEKARANGNKLANANWLGPRWVASLPSTDSDRQRVVLFSAALGGPDWPQLPESYAPLSEAKSQMIERAKPLETIRALHNYNPDIDGKLKDYADEDVKWLPLMSKSKDMLVLIDAHSAEIIEVVDINPWL